MILNLLRHVIIIVSWTMMWSVLLGDAPLQGTSPAHFRVVWTNNPSTSATTSWGTAKPGTTHSVRYHRKGDPASEQVVAARNGRFSGKERELYYHHVYLTDLEPSTEYVVQAKSDRDQSREFYFSTAPDHNRPFSILHGGDSRSDSTARRRVNAMMARLVAKSYANEDEPDDIVGFAHGGDYIASGSNLAQWSQWLSDQESTIGMDGRLLPIIPARGNHDRGKPFNEVFGFPSDDLNYYGVDLGPQVRFVTLNTEISTAGDQAAWLENELKQARPNCRWLLAQYHRPAYPAVKFPSTALLSWVPLFEKYHVDLVLESDGHTIKRTVPIRKNKPDKTGVVYIGEGGLGVPQRTPKKGRWYLQKPGMADRGHHVFVITFTSDQIVGKCVLEDESIRDTFSRPVRNLDRDR